jgi:hypothetical protein
MLYNYLILPKNAVYNIIEIMIAGFFPAFLTGHIFSMLTRNPDEKTNSSTTYSADLAGSALGFIIISSVAVPFLGVKVSIYVLAAIVFGGLLSIMNGKRLRKS